MGIVPASARTKTAKSKSTASRVAPREQSSGGTLQDSVVSLVIMSQIGHADIKTTQDYYLASMQDVLLGAVDAIAEGFFARILKGD